jgi:hypothetical protein
MIDTDSPSIAGAVTGAPYITALELSKKHYILNMHRVGITNPNIAYSVSSLLAGGTASAATMVFTVPLEIISQRQQVERSAACMTYIFSASFWRSIHFAFCLGWQLDEVQFRSFVHY